MSVKHVNCDCDALAPIGSLCSYCDAMQLLRKDRDTFFSAWAALSQDDGKKDREIERLREEVTRLQNENRHLRADVYE